MTTEVYITVILPLLCDELVDRGLTLCQDADSAYTSGITLKWCQDNNLPLITLPGVFPDFSILESMAHPIKRKFYAKRYTTERAAIARFQYLFENEMDQEAIQKMYSWYTKRLHECRRAKGQMTRY